MQIYLDTYELIREIYSFVQYEHKLDDHLQPILLFFYIKRNIF